MGYRFETAANAIKQAENALETLKQFTDDQHKAKGEMMIEQIIDYIADTLSDAKFIFGGCKYNHLGLDNGVRSRFCFRVSKSTHDIGIPLFFITLDGEVHRFEGFEEWQMITIINEWNGFKEELDFAIKTALEERTKSINNQLSHIGYVNEQLSKWKV